MTYDVHQLRAREFPWTERDGVIYLNHASTGPYPARALATVNEINALRAEPHRLPEERELAIAARARELAARLINASPGEIACTVNTSYGINLAARALPLAPGDVVVAPDREFPANVYPWMALERRGVRFERVPCRDGLPDEDALLRALERPEVRVLAVSWVSFATGARVDLAALGRACHERGAYLVVDAIQGVGAATLDVRACHVDILACGGQKWLLAPWGSGFVYVREELARTLEPFDVSWMAMRGSDDFTRLVDYDFTYRDDARRFEMITLPYQDFAGLNASLELIHELGAAAVEAHIVSLVDDIIAWATSRSDVRLVTPRERARRAGIVSVVPHDVRAASERLARAGVAHSVREGAIRLSPHCYNTADEVRRALAVMTGEER